MVLGLFWLVACSGQNDQSRQNGQDLSPTPQSSSIQSRNLTNISTENDEIQSENAASAENQSDLLLLAGTGSSEEADSVTISLFGKPLSLGGKRSLKLTGIVGGRGNDRRAVIEIGGVGRVVTIGDKVESYRVKSINSEEICLARN